MSRINFDAIILILSAKMLLFNCVLFVYVTLYFVSAGQAIFYKICFGEVFRKIPASEFIGIRRIADPILDVKLRVVYIGGLLVGGTFCVLCYAQSLLYQIASLASFAFFVLDIILAKKYSIPLNQKIREVSYSDDVVLKSLQMEWIRWILIRGNICLTGFAVLLSTIILS